MIRATLLGLAAIWTAAPAFAAGGAIRGGEHEGFTRLVLTIEPETEWSLVTEAGSARLRFPGRRIAFETGGTFEKIPRARVVAVESAADDAGTSVSITLGCACRVSTSFVGARYLAVDIADPVEPGPAAGETPEARTAREARVVAGAEEALIHEIERAANQGIVELSRKTPGRGNVPPVGLEALPRHGQIEAMTVYDRDGRDARAEPAPAPVPEVCLADDRLDLEAWSNGLPVPAQLATLRRGLVGEFDAPDPAGVTALARLYIRLGFGAEAEALLRAFPDADLADRSLLTDLARVVDGGAAAPGGPLAAALSCPGRHGLWQALGGVAPVRAGEGRFAETQAAFAMLPVDLRALVAPGLVERLIDAGQPGAARTIHDIAVRPGTVASPALELAAARLRAAEGEPAVAATTLAALVEHDGHAPVEALATLARLTLDTGLPVADGLLADLGAAALLERGTAREAPLRGLAIEALARRAALPEAIREARAAARDLPDEAAAFDALAVRALGEADPAAVGPAVYADTVLAAGDLVGHAPAKDPARKAIAGKLIDQGLPRPALIVLAPLLATGDEAARLLAARARLALGDAEGARAALGPLQGREATELRARAFALDGAYGQALRGLDDHGLAAEAAPYVWPSGDWTRAEAETEGDPDRRAMAAYMRVGTGRAPAPLPAPDPAALDAAGAFREPLPPLERPSLAAARQLVSIAPQVGSFVRGLLAAD